MTVLQDVGYSEIFNSLKQETFVVKFFLKGVEFEVLLWFENFINVVYLNLNFVRVDICVKD